MASKTHFFQTKLRVPTAHAEKPADNARYIGFCQAAGCHAGYEVTSFATSLSAP